MPMQKDPKQAAEKTTAGFARRGALFKYLKQLLSGEHVLTQTRRAIVLDELIDSASLGVDFFVLITLSSIIATFGLILDSPAVIIGAMLVAPLMSSIMGISLASVTGYRGFFKRSLNAVLAGAGTALVLAALLALLTYRLPYGAQPVFSREVLTRTKPSLFDLGIALAGGTASAYALAHPRLSAVLPGVAISTALMPPICTIGIGIAFLNPPIVLGAALLFATNLVAIAFAGMLTFALMGFRPHLFADDTTISRSLRVSTILVLSISITLGVFAWNSIAAARDYRIASRAILESASQFSDVRLVDLDITSENEKKKITFVLRTTRELTYDELHLIQLAVSERIKSPIALELVTVPMQVLDTTDLPASSP
jgi:uncharacterized hydrophobic protein (TIGR00271 family)